MSRSSISLVIISEDEPFVDRIDRVADLDTVVSIVVTTQWAGFHRVSMSNRISNCRILET